MRYLFCALAGLFAGVVGGMGMGGGTVLIPLLTMLNGIPQHTAQAVNLISFVPMAAVALILHIKNKLVEFKSVLYVILPGTAFAAVFAYIASNVDGDILKRVFGGFLVVLAFIQFFADKIAKFSEK